MILPISRPASIAIVIISLFAAPAAKAQMIPYDETCDWTFQVGGERYGVIELEMSHDHTHWTIVYFGKRTWNFEKSLNVILVFAAGIVLAIGLLTGAVLHFKRRKR